MRQANLYMWIDAIIILQSILSAADKPGQIYSLPRRRYIQNKAGAIGVYVQVEDNN